MEIQRPEKPEQVKKPKKEGKQEGRKKGREGEGRQAGRQIDEGLHPPPCQEEAGHFQKGAPSPAGTLIYEDLLTFSP